MEEKRIRPVWYASKKYPLSFVVAMVLILAAASTGMCQRDDASSQAMESLNEALSSDADKDDEIRPRTDKRDAGSDEQIMGMQGVIFGMTQRELTEKISNSAICQIVDDKNMKCRMKDASIAVYKDLDLLFIFSKNNKILAGVEINMASSNQDSLLKLFTFYKDKLTAKYGPPADESEPGGVQFANWDLPALSILSVCNEGEFLISFASAARK
jgi:hypothetical protein